jgi:uncharacterized protein YggE
MSDQAQVWKMGKWVGIALVVFLAVISIKQLVSISYIGKQFPSMNTIAVSGKGEAISIPDIATFSFSVTETAKTVKQAQDLATAKINKSLVDVKAKGVEDKDIKTLSYSINPKYEYSQGVCNQYGCPNGRSVLVGYEVSQSIQVKVREISKAGEMFDTLGKVGIENVNGLTFSIDDIEYIKSIARANAIKNAEAKAEKIAKDLGVSLVKVISFYDSSDDQYPMYAREVMSPDMMSAKASVAPSVPTGEQKVTANVSVTYEIR